jgi:uncharacterized protein YcbK (DUF882 family)
MLGFAVPGPSITAVLALLLATGVALADPPKPSTQARVHGTASTHATAGVYRSYVQRWHSADPDGEISRDESGRPKLVLVSLNTNERVELSASADQGLFSASELDRAAFALREPSSGNAHPVEPRLIDLVYRIQTHFAAQEVRIISGYRTPHGRNASNHGRGRAIDLVVPGTSDADVASFARELGFVGVGIYPTSGFVHIDVRERSYFWVDASSPGRRNRERGVMHDVALKSDSAAKMRGERGLEPFSIATDVDAELRERSLTPPASAPDTDDDDATDG